MKLEVYLDIKSPYAYIAKDSAYALEQTFGLEIDWYPLTLNLVSYLGSAKTNNSGKVVEDNRSPRQWMAVKYAYADARRYASLRGFTFRGTQKIWDTSIVHIGFLWVKMQSRELLKSYLDIAYKRFWRRELDVENADIIVDLMREIGAKVEGFDHYLEGEGRQYHDQLQVDLLNKGYFGVPTYVVNGVSYFGREHLPRVRWHLQDKRGPCPDIAYDSRTPPLDDQNNAVHGLAEIPAFSFPAVPLTRGFHLTICIDFSDPGCYVALNAVFVMIEKLSHYAQYRIQWLPFTTNLSRLSGKQPLEKSGGDPLKDYKAQRRTARQKFADAEYQRISDALNLEDAQRDIDTRLVALALLFLNQSDSRSNDSVERFVLAVFEVGFRLESDLSSMSVVSELLITSGYSIEEFGEFCATEGKKELAALEAEFLEHGVFKSPAFLLQGERYLGREHLPLVEWKLGGQQGLPPT